MSHDVRPPRAALRLLELTLPADEHDHITGDLYEVYAARRVSGSALGAQLWYWKESIAFSARFLAQRLRERPVPQAAEPRTGGGSARPSLLDVKLGARMLVKHPALTVIGGLSIAVTIAVGAAWFEFANDYIRPSIPIAHGDRLVGLLNWNVATSETEQRSLHEFAEWRQELRSVEMLGAYSTQPRNFITEDGRSEPIPIAQITASGFRITGDRPLLGRPLLESDEEAGAENVVVIGHRVWQSRFDGDPGVIGRTVRLGAEMHTVVGVMPEGFGFPVNHSAWVPLRVDRLPAERRAGPSIKVFGRLADGATLEDAQAELAALGARAAAQFPETNEHLRPRVLPYVESMVGIGPVVQLGNIFFILLLVVACTSVATLVFARTATRTDEIAVRSALGASRRRIIVQLFMEALVLATLSAAAGVAMAAFGLRRGMRLFWEAQGGLHQMPFWWNDDLAPATVLYVGLLTLIGAAVIGVLPALRVTSGGVQDRLRQAASGGSSARFGGLWTGLIVAQVALTVLAVSVAATQGRESLRILGTRWQPPAEILMAQLQMELETQPGMTQQAAQEQLLARFGRLQEELRTRLQAEPGVVNVTFGNQLPTTSGWSYTIEVEGDDASATGGQNAFVISVDAEYFRTMGVPVMSGRDFVPADPGGSQRAVIANHAFVVKHLGGRNPLGRRVRPAVQGDREPGPWLEIVGVVRDAGMQPGGATEYPALYHATSTAAVHPLRLAVRVAGDPMAFTPRLRAITTSLDPRLRVQEPQALHEVTHSERVSEVVIAGIVGILAGMALILSAAGIYSLMSLAVSQRTREIGIRVALGAEPRRILTAIFGRALVQLGGGVAIGGGLILLLVIFAGDEQARLGDLGLAVAVAAFVVAVGLLACLVPARRGLRIQPTEALKGS